MSQSSSRYPSNTPSQAGISDVTMTVDRKRPRHEMDEELLTDHPSLYFDDGNVILQCQKTLFCVHKSLLSKHSPVFREILAPGTAQMLDLRGKTLLKLQDDKDDMEALLNTIYDGLRVDFPEITILNFPTVAGMLRLSSKYGLDRLKTDILVRLKQEWPASLAGHLEKNRLFTQKITPSADGRAVYDADQDLIVDPAAVIALLREIQCTDVVLLAPLFYDLSRRIWQLAGAATGHHLGPLSAADVERLVIGVARLRASHVVSFAMLTTKLRDDHTTCKNAWVSTYQPDMQKMLLREANLMSEPVEDWEAAKTYVKAIPTAHNGVCAPCKDSVFSYLEHQQRSVWNSLAASFELVMA